MFVKNSNSSGGKTLPAVCPMPQGKTCSSAPPPQARHWGDETQTLLLGCGTQMQVETPIFGAAQPGKLSHSLSLAVTLEEHLGSAQLSLKGGSEPPSLPLPVTLSPETSPHLPSSLGAEEKEGGRELSSSALLGNQGRASPSSDPPVLFHCLLGGGVGTSQACADSPAPTPSLVPDKAPLRTSQRHLL